MANDLNDWNALVPPGNRLDSPNRNERRPAGGIPTHIVIHVTGTDSLNSVRQTFLARNSVSAHYLVLPDGGLFQFVKDGARAYHAGIDQNTRKLYEDGFASWSRYLKNFGWYKGYPADAVYVDGDGKPVWGHSEAAFVMRADGSSWSEFAYFSARWPEATHPVNFKADPDPNNYSIGIEILGFGSREKNKTAYTDAMYATLGRLTKDLSAKYGIPCRKGRILGHEDVNPIGRFGWDPHAGFDWSAVWSN